MDKKGYQILVVDDHPIVSAGIQNIANRLEGAKCVKADNMRHLQQMLEKEETFDLYIVDLELQDTNGFQLIDRLASQKSPGNILVYTMHEEPWIMAKLATLDIQGAVSKNDGTDHLLAAIRTLRQGGKYFGGVFAELANGKTRDAATAMPSELSAREKEVLSCLSQGMNTTEIARTMFLSDNTVQTYRKRLMTKLNARNVAELVYKAKGWF